MSYESETKKKERKEDYCIPELLARLSRSWATWYFRYFTAYCMVKSTAMKNIRIKSNAANKCTGVVTRAHLPAAVCRTFVFANILNGGTLSFLIRDLPGNSQGQIS